MRIHLDPVGGIAGDMFIAACVDTWPDLASETIELQHAFDVPRGLGIEVVAYEDGVLTGKRFVVREPEAHHHHHVAFADLRTIIEGAHLSVAVQRRAVDIFFRLADAEARVHGKSVETITFHEVGAWDSVIDVRGAAIAIEALGSAQWTVGSLPIGGGRVKSAHGLLPVPAPATTILLKGMVVMHGDGAGGERVTPTGAAILSHLQPDYLSAIPPLRLQKFGIGFGSRRLEGINNMLRLLVFEELEYHGPTGSAAQLETICVLKFEIDDQSPKDLGYALEALREQDGVLDVVEIPAFGKKGRLITQVQDLTRPERAFDVVDYCFSKTTTLGIRRQEVQRTILERLEETVCDDGVATRVKIVVRPGGRCTVKAQLADVAQTAGGHARRQARRARAESIAPRADNDHKVRR